VHPGHARKMAEKLQGLATTPGSTSPPPAGHGYGKDNKERAAFNALGFAFLRDKIAGRTRNRSDLPPHPPLSIPAHV